jgi:hypothetical protein
MPEGELALGCEGDPDDVVEGGGEPDIIGDAETCKRNIQQSRKGLYICDLPKARHQLLHRPQPR